MAAAAGLALVLLWAWLVAAHAHPWMMDGASECCGANDCLAYGRGALERVPGGWRVKQNGQFFADGDKGIYGSDTTDTVWICWRAYERVPTARCIFILPEGF